MRKYENVDIEKLVPYARNARTHSADQIKKIQASIRVKSEEHPTMKPLELVGRALKNSSKKGNIVLDLFGGSGTTLIAAEQTERICYMMELDPKYMDVIINRYETLTGDKAVKIKG